MCTRPRDMWATYSPGTKTGRKFVGIRPDDGGDPVPMKCCRCIECRRRYSYEWMVRLLKELRYHNRCCFVTLTYDDEHLPGNCSLNPRDVELFLKRLRKLIGPFRYFYCGEYGDQRGRPHYHLLIFGFDFRDDAVRVALGKFGDPLYSSDTLTKAWSVNGKPIGIANFGNVTSASIGYVSAYGLKKQYGEKAKRRYQYVDPAGEVHERLPEFVRMSRRPGIGRRYFDQFADEMFALDSVVSDGREGPIPSYFERVYKDISLQHAQHLEDLKLKREARALERAELEGPRTELRTAQIEAYQAAVQKRFTRDFD